MGRPLRIYLVPGFFGFANLGDLTYFAHVLEFLGRAFAARGVEVEIHRVETHPTASLRYRAKRLLARIEASAGDDGPIHIIGHSSGGLDARLLVTSGVSLDSEHDVERIVSRVESVVTVATPHHGTPVASFFTGLLGQRMLQVLSLFTIYVIRFGRLPVGIWSRLTKLLAHGDRWMGRDKNLADQLIDQLLGDFSEDRREALRRFFREVQTDTALLPQLMPDAMDTFNASTVDRPNVRYGSVVTMGRVPKLRSRISAGLDPYAQFSRGVYGGLYRLSTRMPAIRVNELSDAHRQVLERLYPDPPDWRSSDGVVPTLSQPWGEILDACIADHHDVIGHFHAPRLDPPHFDWLASGSGFGRANFEHLWDRVVRFILAR